MEGSGRVASQNSLRNFNRIADGDSGGGSGGGRRKKDNISSIRQTSGTGYEGSSEDTQ